MTAQFRLYIKEGANDQVYNGYPGMSYINRRLSINAYLAINNRPLDLNRATTYAELAYTF